MMIWICSYRLNSHANFGMITLGRAPYLTTGLNVVRLCRIAVSALRISHTPPGSRAETAHGDLFVC